MRTDYVAYHKEVVAGLPMEQCTCTYETVTSTAIIITVVLSQVAYLSGNGEAGRGFTNSFHLIMPCQQTELELRLRHPLILVAGLK